MEQILQQILNKLDNLEAGQQELRYDVRALKAGQEKLEAEVTGIKADITGIKTDITDIRKDTARIPYVEQAVFELNQDGKQVQETVERHEIRIGTLSARSLEHEVKLKNIV